ncbi:hypothetical protein D7D81_08255 [Halocella sp. SP3-1]|nr:hypothetical protein D7D81_08255 [Halocella sp. SP3-1]
MVILRCKILSIKIRKVLLDIHTSIMVWNEIEKRWEKKEVEEEVCKDKEVEVENDDNSDDSDIPK